jgi:general secretion pathway protein L
LSTLYIRLPSKAAADSASHWIALACPFALAAHGGAIEREGMAPLSELAEAVAKAQRVVLLLAASDVSLLRVKVPPMSAARLKSALPHLVEDRLMSDPAECVVAAGAVSGGLRMVAVVNRVWLEILSKTVTAFGARSVVALPAQLCLPPRPDGVVAVVAEEGADIELTLRLSEQEGIGLPIMPESAATAAADVLNTLCAVVPAAPITVYVPQAAVPIFRDALDAQPALESRVTLGVDNWPRWIAGAERPSLDLMSGLGAGAGPQINWQPWRWPLALAAAVLAFNAIGLNIDWWHMKREADGLRGALVQTYKSAFPKETVIVDPVAQMKQKIAAAQNQSGRLAPDDFAALAANFGEAWTAVGQSRKVPGIAALEYRERSLLVRLKTDADAPLDQIKVALAQRNLSVTRQPNGIWQIRSGK